MTGAFDGSILFVANVSDLVMALNSTAVHFFCQKHLSVFVRVSCEKLTQYINLFTGFLFIIEEYLPLCFTDGVEKLLHFICLKCLGHQFDLRHFFNFPWESKSFRWL